MKPWTVLPESFYRIIDHSVLRRHKLRMPDEFVQKYGGELSNFVRVNAPVGGIWLVGVERVGKTLWLHDGWQKFMEYYSIGLGHFLIFNYKGNSKFYVHIFDITATEIQYPFTANARRPNHTDNSGHEKEEFGVDNDDSTVDSPQQSPTLTSLELNALHENTANEVQGGKATASPTNQHIDRVSPEHVVKGTRGTKRACLATNFEPDNPSFMVTMKAYNVERASVVLLPPKFAKEHLLNDIDYIELQDSDGRKWPVRCIRKAGRVSCLSKGWAAFVRANKLVTGDVCVFELIQGNEAMFNVSIFPAKNKHAR